MTDESPGAAASADNRRYDVALLWTAGLFSAAVILHNSDHVRRGADSVSRDVFWLGTAAIVTEAALVLLVFQRHRVAPLAAAVVGTTLAAGYVAVHFLPARSWLSDSFTSAVDVSPLSWIAAAVEVAAAVALAGAGLLLLRRRGGLVSAARHRPDRLRFLEAAAHPVVAGFVLSQVVIVAISFGQL